MSLTHIYAHIPGNPWGKLSAPDSPTFCDPGALKTPVCVKITLPCGPLCYLHDSRGDPPICLRFCEETPAGLTANRYILPAVCVPSLDQIKPGDCPRCTWHSCNPVTRGIRGGYLRLIVSTLNIVKSSFGRHSRTVADQAEHRPTLLLKMVEGSSACDREAIFGYV
ncbi:hypothetical protein Bbelb_148470 [Branchiostoma belcheri]|nr:hypothetical protein Bbelb_148470 [Branchiostoma belcheri]